MVSSSSFEDNASVETLVVAGITFGLAHVLSGPDHLCALAVIASSSSSSSSDDSCDDDDENEQDCNDLNIERVDVNDDGKKRMRRETKNAKDDDEESGVVVDDDDDDDEYVIANTTNCLLYTSPSPRDLSTSRMPSSA